MIEYNPRLWKEHLFDIKGSMVRQIFARVAVCVAWSAAVVIAHFLLQKFCEFDFNVSTTAHSLMGLALSMLLVFRTNASYNRYWEARSLWGAIINESRNLGRMAGVLMADAPDLVKTLIGWTMCFSQATMHILRGSKGLGPAAAKLPPDEVRKVLGMDHVPFAVARKMSEPINEARRRGIITDYQQMSMDHVIHLLIDYLGGCERIHKTPVPFPYVVHLRRALLLYCYTLPIALVHDYGWGTVLVTLLVAYLIFGIEEIGVEIDDPFGSDDNGLPLDRFCMTITMNLYWVLQTLPAPTDTPVATPSPPSLPTPTGAETVT
jgi:putative membrane protein